MLVVLEKSLNFASWRQCEPWLSSARFRIGLRSGEEPGADDARDNRPFRKSDHPISVQSWCWRRSCSDWGAALCHQCIPRLSQWCDVSAFHSNNNINNNNNSVLSEVFVDT